MHEICCRCRLVERLSVSTMGGTTASSQRCLDRASSLVCLVGDSASIIQHLNTTKTAPIDIDTSGQLSSGEQQHDNTLPYYGTFGHRHGSTIRSNGAPSSAVSGQTPRHVRPMAEKHTDTMQPPRKNCRVEPHSMTLHPSPSPASTKYDADDAHKVAQFEEWTLEDVPLKRIMATGVATLSYSLT